MGKQAHNETGYPLVWGAPVRQTDGSYRTVVVAPGDPLPGQTEPAPKAAPVSAEPAENKE